MKISKNRTISTIIVFLMLSMIAMPMLKDASAVTVDMTLSIQIQQDPIGVSQPQRFSVRFSPAIPTPTGQVLPVTAVMTLPDGTKTSLGPFNSPEVLGAGYSNVYLIFDYTPTKVGVYYLDFTWNGDATTNPKNTAINFTVQATPVSIVRSTIAYVTANPNPIGIGQSWLVAAWVTPRQTLPGDTFKGFMITFTKPDGTTHIEGPIESFPDGTIFFSYVPDKVGQWTIQFSYPGDVYAAASETGKQTLTVQQEPVPSYPRSPYPNGPLTFPIQPNNKEWAAISGPYLEPSGGVGLGYDSTGSRYNPYSLGPNTAHILWKIPPLTGFAGVIGGQFGELSTYTKTSATVNVVIADRAYYNNGSTINCADINTGQTLWTAPGTYNFGLISTPTTLQTPANSAAGISTTPELVSITASRFIKYNAATGQVTLNMTSIGGVMSYMGNDGAYAYLLQRAVNADPLWGYYDIIKLDITGTGTDLATRIVYNVTAPFNNSDFGSCIYGDTLCLIHFSIYGNSGAINTTTGATLWAHPIEYLAAKPEHVGCQNGVMYYVVDGRIWKAIDMAKGTEVWTSEQADYPWGDFWGYGQGDAYGMLYTLSYGGIYAFNATTGKIVWQYENSSPYSETPYGVYPYGSNDPIIADGKIYAPESEHSPTFYYKGWHLDVLDAYTGTFLWRIGGLYSVNAIADGILQTTNAEDGYAYAFGKGPTATTISTSAQVMARENSALLTGTVRDMSSAQKGTAAVSDASMTDWMEHLHMQQPLPSNATGVEVSLDAIDPNNNLVHLGTTTTDTTGAYSMIWQPDISGKYIITASFKGSESYYMSSAQTTMSITESAATPTTTSTASVDYTSTIMSVGFAVIIAMIVAIAVATLLIIRKRP